jgi:hypothetical protein
LTAKISKEQPEQKSSSEALQFPEVHSGSAQDGVNLVSIGSLQTIM